ncbi:hypothetical protein Pd630_LPD03813 [Rhodococcus opacus PD630]|nr:hypothetical protein Pd630_LPD03813 [Rhodococcus opacus PD630]
MVELSSDNDEYADHRDHECRGADAAVVVDFERKMLAHLRARRRPAASGAGQ